jgi:hypothetical protein
LLEISFMDKANQQALKDYSEFFHVAVSITPYFVLLAVLICLSD